MDSPVISSKLTFPMMKTKCLALLLLLAAFAHADELTKSVQTELKSQGFFYTEVTGVNGPETVAAIKRYQIRNGLEVTGTLTKETLEALNIQGNAPAAPAPAPVEREAPPKPEARPMAPKDNNAPDADREFLKKPVPAPRVPPAPTAGGEYAKLFARTPYETAPSPVQESTIKRAQKFLLDQGFFRARIDGAPSPALGEAILGYQRLVRLPLTGRLDMETLSAMRMLPGEKGAPPIKRGVPVESGGGSRVYRGVWVD